MRLAQRYKLIEPLGLHPLAVEDSTDANQIPKIDDYRKHTFMIFNAYRYADHALSIHELDVFIGANFLITVQQRDSQGRPILVGAEHLAELHRASVRQGPDPGNAVDIGRRKSYISGQEETIAVEQAILGNLRHFKPAELYLQAVAGGRPVLRTEIIDTNAGIAYIGEAPCTCRRFTILSVAELIEACEMW
jgi:hypothetical protein